MYVIVRFTSSQQSSQPFTCRHDESGRQSLAVNGRNALNVTHFRCRPTNAQLLVQSRGTARTGHFLLICTRDLVRFLDRFRWRLKTATFKPYLYERPTLICRAEDYNWKYFFLFSKRHMYGYKKDFIVNFLNYR